jgi:flagellin-specific chaperone FliS
MMELYEDLEKIYNEINERLVALNNDQSKIVEREKLVAWIKEILNDMRICLQAIAENKLCSNQ